MRRAMRVMRGVSLGVSLTAAAGPVAAQSSVSKDKAQAAAQAPAAPAVCRGGQREDFAGATLDRARWTTVVRETPDLRLADGNLVIPTTNTDIILTPGHPIYSEKVTPNVVLQVLPQGPFTATAKLKLSARQPYQQAGLVVYADDDNYTKLVFHARDANATERYVALLREEEGEVSQELSPPLGADVSDTAWVRFTSDGQTLRAAYSADGTRFTNLPEQGEGMPLRLGGGASPKIGLLALAGAIVEAPVIDAKFDWFELCPGAAGK